MTYVHDVSPSGAHTLSDLRNCETRRGQIWLAHTSGGVNCENGWVAAASPLWLSGRVFLAFREGKDMNARVALHVLAVLTVAALVVLATGLTTVQASIVTPLGWGA